MKKPVAVIIALLVTFGFVGIIANLFYLLNLLPHRHYSNADFGITTFISSRDKDADGIDDQTDILESAKSYVATEPIYQSRYYAGGYPDDGYGVCTDVVAFALLGAGYDLRELLDADIRLHPERYDIEIIDKNIDFRRVDNLKRFFDYNAESLTTSISDIDAWQGGDIVVFEGHIGIVSDTRNRNGVPFVIHHYSPWQRFYEEDILELHQDIIGHYRINTQELFSEYLDRADAIVQKMSLEEKVAQLFLVRFPQASDLATIVAAQPGGFILFAQDFQGETKSSIIAKLQSLQDTTKINFIFGVDEEGGTVTRVSRFGSFRAERFAAPQALYQQGGITRLAEDAHEKSLFLESLGLNMNLAPVADVPTQEDSFIYSRSLGQNALETARYVEAVVTTMNTDGMISVMKHFPGYGDNSDTHTGVAVDERTYDALAKADLLPFISGIKADGPVILVSHNIITAIDDAMPASLSKPVHDILRNQLDFTGVIMTDDLAMGAVQEYAKSGQAAIDAVLAGNDLIITSDFPTQQREVLTAVKQGKIREAQIDTSARRIIALKLAYGVIE